jgi:hypothetical protein
MSFPTVAGKAVNGLPYREAQMCLGKTWANSYYQFYVAGTTTPTNVYQNGILSVPFPTTGKVTADSYGRFPPIWLDTSVTYKVVFFNSANVQQWALYSYVPSLATVGTSALSPYGFQIAPTGELVLYPPNSGGTGATLTLTAGDIGSASLQLAGTLAGNSALIVNGSATTGAQTATFQANNKPGTPPTTYAVTATAAPSGGAYTGGTLTAAFTGTTGSNYTVQLSTLQDIFGATFTNGSTAFTTPSTIISGTPTTALSVQTPVTPAGWLPITCDNVQYYTPIWHGNNFTPYVANPTAIGEAIAGTRVTFGGSGVTVVAGGAATPSSWFSPTTPGIGTGYYIKITRLGGTPGVNFSAAQGVWTNIGAGGLTVTYILSGTVNGSYQISTSNTGSPIVAAGSISLGVFAVTDTYTSGSGVEVVPNGAATMAVYAWGGGGSGDSVFPGSIPGDGGGGGAYCISTGISVTGGQTFTYAVGAGGVGVAGPSNGGNAGTSTVTGTGVAISAGGGFGGVLGTGGGAGGSASGGNLTNSPGQAGQNSAAGGHGGNNGAGANGGNPGGGSPGGGSQGYSSSQTPPNGGSGQVQFVYS